MMMVMRNYGAQIDSCYKRMPIARIKVHVVKKTKVLDDRREKKQMSLVHSFKKKKRNNSKNRVFLLLFSSSPLPLEFQLP